MSSSTQQDVTAAIVNYGSDEDTRALVRAIESQVKNVIVVDNSNDLDPLDPTLSAAQIICPKKNIGFGAAINLAATFIDTRWLLILNPDVRLKGDCLQHMLTASRQLHAPLCGPRFFWDEDCTLQLPPALGHPLWLLSDRLFPNKSLSDTPDLSALAIARHERFWNEQAPFSEPVLSGACLLVDYEWFTRNQMPIFDEDFFLYYEDTDLCGRLMRKGVMPICVAEASAVHYWNQSSEPPEGKVELMQASENIFLQKYYPNGPPPLPSSTGGGTFNQLGLICDPPIFSLPEGTAHLDIGVQEDFIVFIRADIQQKEYAFPEGIWDRIRPGEYFMRASDGAGNILDYWHWTRAS